MPKGNAIKDIVHPEDYEQTIGFFRDTAENDRKNRFENRVMRQDPYSEDKLAILISRRNGPPG